MFRDLKEYQEIAKIYTDKVSKPEDLEERRGSSPAELKQKREKLFPATPPQKGMGGGVGNPTNRRGSGAKTIGTKPEIKKFPSTAEIRAANQGRVGGGNAGASTDSGGTSQSTIKSVEQKPDPKPMSTRDKFKSKFIKKDKGVGFVRRGTPMAQRAENKEKNKMRAQEMAKARIAAKKEGTASPQMSGADRAKAMAKARLAKKAGMAEGAGVALKLGGMIAPKIPSALKAIGAGAATGASVLGIKKKAEEGRPAKRRKQTKTIDQVKADNEIRKEKEREESARQRFIKKDQEYDNMAQAQYETDLEDAKDSPKAQKFEADKIKKARQAFKTGTKQESYTPDAYDLVLEYLLSSEQAATIEEANYVMTEMDAETIQGIVEEQKKTLDEMDMMKMPVVNVIGGTLAGVAALKGAASYLGRKAGERSIKKTEPKKPSLIKTIKDKTDATNKAIEQM